MKTKIPSKVVRSIIADILLLRSEVIEEAFNEVCQKAEREGRNLTDYESELGVTAAGTRVMSDDVKCGNISVKEAIDSILEPDEIEMAKEKISQYLKNSKS